MTLPAAPPASVIAAAPGARQLTARLAAAHIEAPRAESVVIDLAADPPLARGLAEAAVAHAARIVEGAGAAMVAARARRGAIAVRDAAAHDALEAAVLAAGAATLRVTRVADVWPHAGLDRELDCRLAWVLAADSLFALEAVAFDRPRLPRRITVAGSVKDLRTIAFDPAAGAPTVEKLVAAAGPTTEPWVALDGGPWGGRIADPDAPPRSPLVLVLPAGHALLARARVSLGDQLRRVASACEGCRACTDVCPPFLDGAPLEPHAIVAALAAGDDRAARTAGAAACLVCGVCTAACPSALEPAALVASVRSRLPADLPPLRRGRRHPDYAMRRLGVALLLLRAGLAAPAQAVTL